MDEPDKLDIPEFLRRRIGETSNAIPVVTKEVIIPPVVDVPVEGPSQFEKIQRGMRENASDLIAEINSRYDDFILNGTEFNAYEFFRSREVKPAITKIIVDKFKPELNEILLSYSDPELKRAYSNINTKEAVKFLDSIIADGDRWIDNQNAGKGTRKRRVVKIKPEKKIKSLKYQAEDRALKLLSIPAEKIIGAQELWTYNTKYKHLTHYVARSRAGLTVKGTTLQDFDIDHSITKVVRKPEEVLTKVLEKKKKIMDGLKTKGIVPTGRINGNTILLRVG